MPLERKTRALDQAAPLQGWALPAVFAELRLRRLLEARLEKQGRREFVQVLRLLEVFPLAEVAAAIQDAIDRGALGFDAIKRHCPGGKCGARSSSADAGTRWLSAKARAFRRNRDSGAGKRRVSVSHRSLAA
jgi:hypothetical protein